MTKTQRLVNLNQQSLTYKNKESYISPRIEGGSMTEISFDSDLQQQSISFINNMQTPKKIGLVMHSKISPKTFLNQEDESSMTPTHSKGNGKTFGLWNINAKLINK